MKRKILSMLLCAVMLVQVFSFTAVFAQEERPAYKSYKANMETFDFSKKEYGYSYHEIHKATGEFGFVNNNTANNYTTMYSGAPANSPYGTSLVYEYDPAVRSQVAASTGKAQTNWGPRWNFAPKVENADNDGKFTGTIHVGGSVYMTDLTKEMIVYLENYEKGSGDTRMELVRFRTNGNVCAPFATGAAQKKIGVLKLNEWMDFESYVDIPTGMVHTIVRCGDDIIGNDVVKLNAMSLRGLRANTIWFNRSIGSDAANAPAEITYFDNMFAEEVPSHNFIDTSMVYDTKWITYDYENTGVAVGEAPPVATLDTNVVIDVQGGTLYQEEDGNYCLKFTEGAKHNQRIAISNANYLTGLYYKFRIKLDENFPLINEYYDPVYFGIALNGGDFIWKINRDLTMTGFGRTMNFKYTPDEWMTVEMTIEQDSNFGTITVTQGDNTDSVKAYPEELAHASNHLMLGSNRGVFRIETKGQNSHCVTPQDLGKKSAKVFIDDITVRPQKNAHPVTYANPYTSFTNGVTPESVGFSAQNATLKGGTLAVGNVGYPRETTIEIGQEANTTSSVTHSLDASVKNLPFRYVTAFSQKNITAAAETLTGSLKIYAVTANDDGTETQDVLLAAVDADEKGWIGEYVEGTTVKELIGYDSRTYGSSHFSANFDPATKTADVKFGSTSNAPTGYKAISGTVAYTLPNIVAIKYVSASGDAAQAYHLNATGYSTQEVFEFYNSASTGGFIKSTDDVNLVFTNGTADVDYTQLITVNGQAPTSVERSADGKTLKVNFAKEDNTTYRIAFSAIPSYYDETKTAAGAAVVSVKDGFDVYGVEFAKGKYGKVLTGVEAGKLVANINVEAHKDTALSLRNYVALYVDGELANVKTFDITKAGKYAVEFPEIGELDPTKDYAVKSFVWDSKTLVSAIENGEIITEAVPAE